MFSQRCNIRLKELLQLESSEELGASPLEAPVVVQRVVEKVVTKEGISSKELKLMEKKRAQERKSVPSIC